MSSVQEIKWPSFNEEKNADVSPRDYFLSHQLSVLCSEDGIAILNLILLCDVPEGFYKALLFFSAQGIVCFENNLLKGVLKLTVNESLQFSYSAHRWRTEEFKWYVL